MSANRSARPSRRLSPRRRTELAYYTVANAAYFLGTVALLNSLRRVGEHAPLFVVDCGLTAAQRERLSTLRHHRSASRGPASAAAEGDGAARTSGSDHGFIDADILVTRPLGPLLARRHGGSGRGVRGLSQPRPLLRRVVLARTGRGASAAVRQQRLVRVLLGDRRGSSCRCSPKCSGRWISRSTSCRAADRRRIRSTSPTRISSTRCSARASTGESRGSSEGSLRSRRSTASSSPTASARCAPMPTAWHRSRFTTLHRKPWLAPLPANLYSRAVHDARHRSAGLSADRPSRAPAPPDQPSARARRPLASLEAACGTQTSAGQAWDPAEDRAAAGSHRRLAEPRLSSPMSGTFEQRTAAPRQFEMTARGLPDAALSARSRGGHSHLTGRVAQGDNRSVLAQTFTSFRLIVSDNASDDDTPEVVAIVRRRTDRVRALRAQYRCDREISTA